MAVNFPNLTATSPKVTRNKLPKAQTAFERKAHEAAQKFEAVFLSQILKSMSVGIKSKGLFSGGSGEEIFKDVMNEQIAKQIARSGGIGLSDSVYREIIKMQEAGPSNAR